MPTKKRMRPTIKLLPNSRDFEERRKKLPKFKPHHFRLLIQYAKDQKTDVISVFRSRNEDQTRQLLEGLGVDPSQPDEWRRGFFRLAHYHHGVGHISWSPRRTNSNPTTWTLDRNLVLLREVSTLAARGLSERAAVRKIASDPQKRQLFPHRPQSGRYFAKMSELKQREAALWAHLQKLKSSSMNGLLRALGGGEANDRNPLETMLDRLDQANQLGPLRWLKTNRGL
jgi:hypothetical protein